MNEKLKEFAAQAGFSLSGDYHCDEYELERFADLVRQDEREANAKLCEYLHNCEPEPRPDDCAAAIRARSEPSPAFKNYMGDNWAGIVWTKLI